MFKIQIIGNLGADASVINSNGNEYVSFRVAHSEKFKKSDGSDIETTIKHMVRYIMCEQCGVYGVSSRTLRTTFAVSMINAGVRDYFVAKMLGTKTLDAAYLQLRNNISFLSQKYKSHFHRN